MLDNEEEKEPIIIYFDTQYKNICPNCFIEKDGIFCSICGDITNEKDFLNDAND